MTNEDCGDNLQNVHNVDCVDGARNLSDAELRWTSFIDRVWTEQNVHYPRNSHNLQYLHNVHYLQNVQNSLLAGVL